MITRLSTKGRLIIPKDLLDRHGWVAGMELSIEERRDGVVLRPVQALPETTLEEILGCTGYRGLRHSLDEMEEAIRRGTRKSR